MVRRVPQKIFRKLAREVTIFDACFGCETPRNRFGVLIAGALGAPASVSASKPATRCSRAFDDPHFDCPSRNTPLFHTTTKAIILIAARAHFAWATTVISF
jgi:hypothetical protein